MSITGNFPLFLFESQIQLLSHFFHIHNADSFMRVHVLCFIRQSDAIDEKDKMGRYCGADWRRWDFSTDG